MSQLPWLSQYPDGVADPQSGETPVAFVVKKDPSLTGADVVVFVNDLPKTPVGKVLRRQLRPAS